MLNIYVPIYNSDFCAEYQIKTLQAFIQDEEYNIVIVDQNFGRHPESSAKMLSLCEEAGDNVFYSENTDKLALLHQERMEKTGDMTLIPYKIGATLNICYAHAKQTNAEYFGFLDQDCFLFSPINLAEILKEKRAYGKVVPTHPDKIHRVLPGGKSVKDVYGCDHAWNLHCIVNFYETQFLVDHEPKTSEDPLINFMPGSWGPGPSCDPSKGVGLDTGGANWFSVWRHQKIKDFWMPEDHYYYYNDLSLLDPRGEKPSNTTYEIHNDRWVHMVHGGVSEDAVEVLSPKFSYIKGFLDSALLSAKRPGAKNTGFRSTHDPRGSLDSFERKEEVEAGDPKAELDEKNDVPNPIKINDLLSTFQS